MLIIAILSHFGDAALLAHCAHFPGPSQFNSNGLPNGLVAGWRELIAAASVDECFVVENAEARRVGFEMVNIECCCRIPPS